MSFRYKRLDYTGKTKAEKGFINEIDIEIESFTDYVAVNVLAKTVFL